MGKEGRTELEELRDERRKSILEAAERVFLEVDFPAASMSAVAEAAGISRPTLYKYFASIDELAFAVQIGAMEALAFPVLSRVPAGKAPDTALGRIEAILRDLAERFEENRAHLRFTGLFDHYYHDGYPDAGLAGRYGSFLARFDAIEELVEEGKRDGSIRADLDSHNASEAIGNAFLATMQRFASRGELLEREQGVGRAEQLEELVRMIVTYAAGQGARKRRGKDAH